MQLVLKRRGRGQLLEGFRKTPQIPRMVNLVHQEQFIQVCGIKATKYNQMLKKSFNLSEMIVQRGQRTWVEMEVSLTDPFPVEGTIREDFM